MKIVNRKTFFEMPENTVFATYEPSVFGGLMMFCGTQGMETDFVEQGLGVEIECNDSTDFADKCDLAETGQEVSLDFECASRNGLFEKDQLFAVFSKEDVAKLIKRLQDAL